MKFNKIFWGLFLLISAAVIIASQVTSFASVGVVSILISIFLVAVMITSIMKLKYFGIFVPLGFLYTIYQEPLELPEISIWILLLVSLLVSGGFSLLFKKKRSLSSYKTSSGHRVGTVSDSTQDDNPDVRVSMNSYSKFLRANNYSRGNFNVSFGSLDLYFDNVNLIPYGAGANINCSFGSAKLYIPRHWNVIDNMESMFGSVKNMTNAANPLPGAPVLTLTGSVKFGEVEVNYI